MTSRARGPESHGPSGAHRPQAQPLTSRADNVRYVIALGEERKEKVVSLVVMGVSSALWLALIVAALI